MWSLAIKSTLGNVYHFGKLEDGSVARCDHRIRLIAGTETEAPEDGYLCARCQTLKQRSRAPGTDPKTGEYSTAQMMLDEMTMGDTSQPLFD